MMPAERTAKGKRDGEDSFQLTWAPPAAAEPTEPQKFSFAPNITPVTFTASPPADEDDIPSQSTFFPDPASSDVHQPSCPDSPIYQPAPKRRRKATSTKDGESAEDGSVTPEHIPRPPNAFILFRSSFIKSQHVSSNIEGNHGTLSKIVGMVWHNLSFEERQIWQAKAKRALAEHKRRFPEYSFRPSNKDKDRIKAAAGEFAKSIASRDGSAPPLKRKQRECGPRDEARCEHIASLVARGLKGRELEDAVKHFDATRAPTVIQPRFEQPITAKQFEASSTKKIKVEAEEEKVVDRAQEMQQQKTSSRHYRRGSSVPLLDSDHTHTVRRKSTFMQCSASPFQPSPIRPYTDAGPSIRSQRKRSASSSPPVRSRTLLPTSSLPSTLPHMQNLTPSLSLSTSMSEVQMHSYNSVAPLSAPALSRQPTLVIDHPSPSDYYHYDSNQPVWYDSAASSSPNTAAGSDYNYSDSQSWDAQPSFDFSSFSFSNASCSTPPPVVPSQAESYSPFDNVQAPPPASVSADFSDMPNLVEPPAHPHPLHIQTDWAQMEYDYDHPHAYYPPSNATPISAADTVSPMKPYNRRQPAVSTPYDMYASPTSPSSASVSDCAVTQVQTPREGSAEPASAIYTHASDPFGAHQGDTSCYPTQLSFDNCMSGMNINVSVNLGSMDPSVFQAFMAQQAKVAGYNYHHMDEMEQSQARHVL